MTVNNLWVAAIRRRLNDTENPITPEEALNYIKQCNLWTSWVYKKNLPDEAESVIDELVACIVNANKAPFPFVSLLTLPFLPNTSEKTNFLHICLHPYKPSTPGLLQEIFVLFKKHFGRRMQNMGTNTLYVLLTTAFKHPTQDDPTTLLNMWINNTLPERYDHYKIRLWIDIAATDPHTAYRILTYRIDGAPSLFQMWCTGTSFPGHLDRRSLNSLLITARTQMATEWQAYIQPKLPFSYHFKKWFFAGLTAVGTVGLVIMFVLVPHPLGNSLFSVFFVLLLIGLLIITPLSGAVFLRLVVTKEKYYGMKVSFPASDNGTSVPYAPTHEKTDRTTPTPPIHSTTPPIHSKSGDNVEREAPTPFCVFRKGKRLPTIPESGSETGDESSEDTDSEVIHDTNVNLPNHSSTPNPNGIEDGEW